MPSTRRWPRAYRKFLPPAGNRASSSPSYLPPVSHLLTANPPYLPSFNPYPHLLTSSIGVNRSNSDNPGDHPARTSSTPTPVFIDARTGTIFHMQAPTPRSRPRSYYHSGSRRQSLHTAVPATRIQLHWLFRSNIPRRRGMPLQADVNKRNFFGIGEIIGVLANPSETLRSLTDSKRMLEETKRELAEARERAQLTPTHTFSGLPGFFDRPAELKAIERALEGEPSFTILFGASSVGKTALLRQVLTRPTYHVLHFDLRIAGFADLSSLYMSFSQQMEGFFNSIAQDPDMPGYEEFEKEAWGFKHDRLNVERRVANASPNGESAGHSGLGDIKTSDVARLMELFQSSLLRYWNFQPDMSSPSRKSYVDSEGADKASTQGQSKKARSSWRRFFGRRKREEQKKPEIQSVRPMNGDGRGEDAAEEKGKGKERIPPMKKIPVVFIDEAHKLPALIRSVDAMKCLLDAMLVLTKQDRLCHVIHATSDPFYQTWLRQLNVMQHCKIMTIGDYPKADVRRFFRERILPSVPEQLRGGLDFERLYDAFGGKLAHWQDYITDYVNVSGKLEVKQSSHFLQAHALLNLHIIHSSQAPQPSKADGRPGATPIHSNRGSTQAIHQLSPPPSTPGFHIYSPLTANPHIAPSAIPPPNRNSMSADEFQGDFTFLQLLKVMNLMAQPEARPIPYFRLCREIGVRAVDGMVRGRILDLRWTDPITKERIDPRTLSMRIRESMRVRGSVRERESMPMNFGAGSSGTMVNDPEEMMEYEDEMVPMTDEEIMRVQDRMTGANGAQEDEDVVGPKLVPITPIMRFAMREVVQEYYDNDDQTVSEYASLSDVVEY